MKKAGASTQHLCRGLISPKRQSLERQEEIKPQTPQEQEATDIAFSSTAVPQTPGKCQQPAGRRTPGNLEFQKQSKLSLQVQLRKRQKITLIGPAVSHDNSWDQSPWWEGYGTMSGTL